MLLPILAGFGKFFSHGFTHGIYDVVVVNICLSSKYNVIINILS